MYTNFVYQFCILTLYTNAIALVVSMVHYNVPMAHVKIDICVVRIKNSFIIHPFPITKKNIKTNKHLKWARRSYKKAFFIKCKKRLFQNVYIDLSSLIHQIGELDQLENYITVILYSIYCVL